MAKLIRLFSVLLAVAFAFSLTACNEEKEEGGQATVEEAVEAQSPPRQAGEPGPVTGQMRTAEPVADELEAEPQEEREPKTREDRDFSLPPIEHQ